MATLTCPFCKQPVRAGAKFCARCGRALLAPPVQASHNAAGVTCARCGTVNRAGAKFCSKCRNDLSVRAPVAQGPAVKCPRCGATNRTGARFCAKCRSDLSTRAREVKVPPGGKSQETRFPLPPRVIAALGAAALVVLVCLVGALVAYNAQSQPTLVASQPSPAPTASVSVIPSPSITATPEASGKTAWQTFDGTGYTLLYPPGWYIHREDKANRAGVRYDLILSNAPDNYSPQSATPDESARVTVSLLSKPQQPLDEWVLQRWAWLDVPLVSVTIEDVPVLMATTLLSDSPVWMEFYWLEYRGHYYTVQAYARSDVPDVLEQIKQVMDSFKLKE